MSWKCTVCGSINGDQLTKCDCGYQPSAQEESKLPAHFAEEKVNKHDEIVNNVSQATEDEGQVLFTGKIGKISAKKITILQKDIPIGQVEKVHAITKRSGWSVAGGVALLILPVYIIPSPLINAIAVLIGLYLIVHGIIGTRYLKIFYSGGEIEVKCNRKKESKLFIDAVNSLQQHKKLL